MSDSRDAEVEVWKVYDRLPGSDLDVEKLRLQAIELIVKIRSAGQRVKPDEQKAGDAATVARARERMKQ